MKAIAIEQNILVNLISTELWLRVGLVQSGPHYLIQN
jgi:hypothetical protein